MTNESIIEIPLDRVIESPSNPRKLFNDDYLQELATDIKANGRVLQPIVVREVTDPNDERATIAEIVFGHCRTRAARLAGFETIPAIVREMTDEQVKRAQISENLQREDIHPIEEAEGFHALMTDHGISADQLAADTGKSRSYIYSRLKLLQACSAVRHACLAGEIGSETALLIARVGNEKLQEKALAAIPKANIDLKDGGKRSFRAIRDHLNEKFTLDLSTAIFDPEDVTLLLSAPSACCTDCPKRSGNAPEFEDILDDKMGNKYGHGSIKNTGPDVCTDPDCFEAKKKAHLAREAKKLEAEGKTVITGNKARAAIDQYGKVKGAFVPLSEVRAELKKASGDKPKTVTIQNPRDGKLIQAVAVADLKSAGVKVKEPAKSNSRGSDDWQAAQKKRQEAAVVETKLRQDIFGQIRAALTTSARNLFELRLVANNLLDRLDYGNDMALLKDYKAESVDSLSPDELGRLIVECCVIEQSQASSYDYEQEPAELHALAEHHGIDVNALRAGGTASTTEPASTPSTAARGAKKAAGKAKETPFTAGAATDDAPIVDDKTLPLALEGGSMHRELTPQAAWPFPNPKGKKQTDEAPAAQIQTDDAASPLSEAAS